MGSETEADQQKALSELAHDARYLSGLDATGFYELVQEQANIGEASTRRILSGTKTCKTKEKERLVHFVYTQFQDDRERRFLFQNKLWMLELIGERLDGLTKDTKRNLPTLAFQELGLSKESLEDSVKKLKGDYLAFRIDQGLEQGLLVVVGRMHITKRNGGACFVSSRKTGAHAKIISGYLTESQGKGNYFLIGREVGSSRMWSGLIKEASPHFVGGISCISERLEMPLLTRIFLYRLSGDESEELGGVYPWDEFTSHFRDKVDRFQLIEEFLSKECTSPCILPGLDWTTVTEQY